MTSRQHTLAAYAELLASGKVLRTRGQVCAWLHAHGPHTRNEIDAALGGGRPNPPHSRRLSELRAAGLLHVVGERDGADLWDVTEEVPPHRPQAKQAKPDIAKAWQQLSKLLHSPRAKVFPDGTLDQALAIMDAVSPPAEGASP